MTEQWHAYLADGSLTDLVLYRDQPIPDGYYHLVVEAIIRHTDGDILLVKRAKTKASFPDYWEASAGGSALFGEIAEQAIRREVLEETGLTLHQLTPYQTFFNDEHQCYFEVFLGITNQDKTSVQLQAEETSDYRWIKPDDFVAFSSTHQLIPRHQQTLLGLLSDQQN